MSTMDASRGAAPSAGLLARVKGILIQPRAEWQTIAAEPATVGGLYTGYVGILAAIPAICGWIGMSMIGITLPFVGHFRVALGVGLVHAVTRYVLTLVGVYLLALLIEWLAPRFDGEANRIQALKVAAYTGTPAWVAGVLALVPALGILQLLAALYCIYLLYLGLPALTRAPQEKALGYTVVVILAAIVIFVVIGAIAGALVHYPTPGLTGIHD
jgi:uncharacterized membrane protein